MWFLIILICVCLLITISFQVSLMYSSLVNLWHLVTLCLGGVLIWVIVQGRYTLAWGPVGAFILLLAAFISVVPLRVDQLFKFGSSGKPLPPAALEEERGL